MGESVIQVKRLLKRYPLESSLRTQLFGNQRYIHAVDDVSFNISEGEIYGIAGESGCGKTTTARCVGRLEQPSSGEILYNGTNITQKSGSKLKEFRREVQMIFQDPHASINDRFTIEDWVKEPLEIHDIGTKEQRVNKVIQTLERSGLRPGESFMDTFPYQLSGGQRQRVAIARALVLDPKVIIADEPTSMLDVSVRAGILKTLQSLVKSTNISILYISHDLSLLRYVCDRISIMYRGQIVESGTVTDVFSAPKHPYTQSLMRAVPKGYSHKGRERVQISSEIEQNIGGVEGCPFVGRCPYEFSQCTDELALQTIENEHEVACHLYDDKNNQQIPTYTI